MLHMGSGIVAGTNLFTLPSGLVAFKIYVLFLLLNMLQHP